MESMEKAIILDGHLKSALAAVRSLGHAGILISVGGDRTTGMGLHSKYVSHVFTYPSPYIDQNGFIQAVLDEAILQGGKPVVYAFSDATYLSLYTHREKLSAYITLPFPNSESIELAFNKGATYSIARVSGVPTITTYMPESKEETERLSHDLTYPAVLKTRRSVTWNDGKGIFGTATFVHDSEELVSRFLSLKSVLGEPPLIQDFLRGEEYGVEMLTHKGAAFAITTHHRIRSMSPTGGASVVKETLMQGDLRSELESYAARIVTALEWSGPIMVEFKVDEDTREPKLMEVNGRFWGSLPLSVAAGVDMPYLYYKYVTEGDIPKPTVVAEEGVVTRHFFGDVRHLMRVLFGRSNMRKIMYPRRMQAIREFFKLPKGTIGDVWSWGDPKPALMEVLDIFKCRIWK